MNYYIVIGIPALVVYTIATLRFAFRTRQRTLLQVKWQLKKSIDGINSLLKKKQVSKAEYDQHFHRLKGLWMAYDIVEKLEE